MFAQDHPFWTATETPVQFDTGIETQPIPGHVIFHEGGQTIAPTGGQEVRPNMRMSPEKYEKFAYSSRYGFSVEIDTRAYNSCVFDNMLGVSLDGLNALVRTTCLDARVDGDMVYSKWKPAAGVEIESWVIATPPGHLRIHRVTNSVDIQVSEGGFALDSERHGVLKTSASAGIAQIGNDADFSIIRTLGNDPRTARTIKCPPNSKLKAPRSYAPQLVGSLAAGSHILSAHIVASPDKASAMRASNDDISLPAVSELERRRDAARTVPVWDAPVQ